MSNYIYNVLRSFVRCSVRGGVVAVLLLLTAHCSLLTVFAQPGVPKMNSPLYGGGPDIGDTAKGLPPVLREAKIEQRLGAQVPLDLTFKDENGRDVKLGQLIKDKPVILSLVYYECPMLCNQVLNGLTGAMKALPFTAGKEFDVVTVSFDPRETPALASEKKQVYLDDYKHPEAADGWHFLTGDEAAIKRLTETVGFYYIFDKATNQYAHASAIMVLTPQGKLSHYFYGIEYAPKELRLGLVEASQNKIGSPVDQLLLYCYHYDPSSGKYGLVVMNIVRAAGIITLIAIGILFLLLRKRRIGGSSAPPTRLAGGGAA